MTSNRAWYVLQDSGSDPQPQGPFQRDELILMMKRGALRVESLVAAVGSSQWIRAADDAELQDLFTLSAPPPAPLPPVTPDVGSRTVTDGGRALPTHYSFANAWSLSWSMFARHWAQFLAMSAIYLAITVVLCFPVILGVIVDAQSGDGKPGALYLLGSCFSYIVSFFVGIPLFAGTAYASAELVSDRKNIGDMFIGFRRYGRVLGASAMVLGIYLACGIAAAIPMLIFSVFGAMLASASQNELFIGLGFGIGYLITLAAILACLAMVIVRLVFAPLIAIDSRLGDIDAVGAMRLSWVQTKGLNWSMFGLFLLIVLISGLSIYLLCIGYLLLGMPIFFAAIGATHSLVFRSKVATAAM